MIEIKDKSLCCGCNTCMQRCPQRCITMREDGEGFLYPQIDALMCIDCGLCERICPVLNQNKSKQPLHVFAAKNKNEEQRLRSSSGGIFILLAEQIIRKGGVVFGARFDENWEVEHCYVETIKELDSLMRSKYVQSRIGNTYKETEEFLKQGRQVLFVGTPCQIAGLRKFLRKEYDNLFAVDFVCHGVPSPLVWRRYLAEVKEQFLRSEGAGKKSGLPFSLKSTPVIVGINFREKQRRGYSWKKFGFVVCTKSSLKGDQNSVLLSTKFYENEYMQAFLGDMILRPSCHTCPARRGKSYSDITIGDHWAISSICPDFDDDKGNSLVFVNTEKGEVFWPKEHLQFIETDFIASRMYNGGFSDVVKKHPHRDRFFRKLKKTENLCLLIQKELKVPLYERVIRKILNIGKRNY